jgi:drug/metabolite transporter (DMT)-like permease
LVTSGVSFAVGLLVEDTNSAMIAGALGPIIYGGVISIGIAYTLQIMAQQKARPTPAAIILSLESVFAVLWGWVFLGETLSGRGILGSGLMLCGMVLAQMNSSEP